LEFLSNSAIPPNTIPISCFLTEEILIEGTSHNLVISKTINEFEKKNKQKIDVIKNNFLSFVLLIKIERKSKIRIQVKGDNKKYRTFDKIKNI
tara:strand:- start:1881 stop:2159 length:279 start_codon:yes stop_codon:yes gene_type:complete